MNNRELNQLLYDVDIEFICVNCRANCSNYNYESGDYESGIMSECSQFNPLPKYCNKIGCSKLECVKRDECILQEIRPYKRPQSITTRRVW